MIIGLRTKVWNWPLPSTKTNRCLHSRYVCNICTWCSV